MGCSGCKSKNKKSNKTGNYYDRYGYLNPNQLKKKKELEKKKKELDTNIEDNLVK